MKKYARSILAALLLVPLLAAGAPSADAELMAPTGWAVHDTVHSYQDLIARVNEAAEAHKMGVVSRASATVGAQKVLNKTIPGNMVVGLYHPRFAVPMLEASLAAGIEAPIRIYITENADGTATLSYKKPSHVFAPYSDGGAALRSLAAELDTVFAAIAAQAAAK